MLRLFAEWGSRLEPDEGEDREDHPAEDTVPASDRVMRVERLQVEVACIRKQHPHGKRSEDHDLEGAENDARRRGDADIAIRQ